MYKCCLQCSHVWIPRQLEHPPKECPKCQSPNWNKKTAPRADYDLSSIEVNGARLIPWFEDSRANYKITNAVRSFSKRTGRKFRITPKPLGLYITRLI